MTLKNVLSSWKLNLIKLQSNWVGERSLFLFFFFFSVFILFFVPYERAKCPGWGRRFRPLWLFSLALHPCLSVLAFTRTDPSVTGVDSCMINIYIGMGWGE